VEAASSRLTQRQDAAATFIGDFILTSPWPILMEAGANRQDSYRALKKPAEEKTL